MSGLVLGANGQVGRCLRPVLPSEQFLNRSQLDLSSSEQIRDVVLSLKPDFIVNAAAYTAVDNAEKEEVLASEINGYAVQELAALSNRLGIPFVHISTDYVFAGDSNNPYVEEDPTGPMNAYGRSKLIGEKPFNVACPGNQWLLRCSWVFSEYGNNFLRTMLNLSTSESLQVVDDQLGRPTYAGDIAWVIGELVKAWRNGSPVSGGIYHCASAGATSWFEFAKEIFDAARELGVVEHFPKLTPISTSEYPTLAPRPPYSVLSTTKLEGALGRELPHWRKGLSSALRTISERL